MVRSWKMNCFSTKLIYIYTINDPSHKGCLKIGQTKLDDEANLSLENLEDNCDKLNEIAKGRIDEQTSTAGIEYDLKYTTLAIRKSSKNKNEFEFFEDHDVQKVLERSGIKRKEFNTNKKSYEWYRCDLPTAISAINAVKENKSALDNVRSFINQSNNKIEWKPHQKNMINETVQHLSRSSVMLWNVKPRSGKTLCALEVARKLNFKRTLVVTHRPIVEDGWKKDFDKLFSGNNEYEFASKKKGKKINELCKENKKFFYFLSLQDARGSDIVGGKYSKDHDVYNTKWDFIILDEAHEGTKTELGNNVVIELKKQNKDIKELWLSGTPFNLIKDFEPKQIFTWDYIMEQNFKKIDSTYSDCPELQLRTYDLSNDFRKFIDIEDKSFNFKEFFKVQKVDDNQEEEVKFVHESEIQQFLDLISSKNETNYFPFSTDEYCNKFRHTLWMVPGVLAAKALSSLLRKHRIFSSFNIINIAGPGDEEIDTKNAWDEVKKAITKNPDKTRTITISCGRLTTGVTIPEWNAVLMLYGSYNTRCATYLQTIFRVQTPWKFKGWYKEKCYAFDFAPDRSLKAYAEYAEISCKNQNKNSEDKDIKTTLGKLLNFCPIISCQNGEMKKYDVEALYKKLNQVFIDRIVKSGFLDSHIYNFTKFKNLTKDDLQKFKKLKDDFNSNVSISNKIEINTLGFDKEEREKIKKIKAKNKNDITPEEQELLKKDKIQRNNEQLCIKKMQTISIRIPILAYGIDLKKDEKLTIDNFCTLIDDDSWKQFMPKNLSKNDFIYFKQFYDSENFNNSIELVRNLARGADSLEPIERTKRIIELFSSFQNPDKETVLTPWSTINKQLTSTLGGYNFYSDADFSIPIKDNKYKLIRNNEYLIYSDVKSKVLEINSKSGLYPLYLAFCYYYWNINQSQKILTFAEKYEIWDKILENHIFVLSKSKMAQSITKRTLIGFRKAKININYLDNLNENFEEQIESIASKIIKNRYWNIKKGSNMKFDAIVGNPPYSLQDGGGKGSQTPIYQYFFKLAKELKPNYISLIIPSRWLVSGKGLNDFRESMFSDHHFKIFHDHKRSTDCFKNVDIKGGVCYFLWDKNFKGKCKYFSHKVNNEINITNRYLFEKNMDFCFRDPELIPIYKKVWKSGFDDKKSFYNYASERKPYGFCSDAFTQYEKYHLPSFSDVLIKDGYKIYGLENNKRIIKYISKEYPILKSKSLNKYKVFVTKAYGCGTIGEVLATPVLATPGELCTETYIELGPVDTITERNNIYIYMY